MKHFLLLMFWVGLLCAGHAQSVNVPLNSDYYHLMDRYEIKSGKLAPQFFSNVKPYTRKNVAAFADSLLRDTLTSRNRVDDFNLMYLANDNWEWSSEHQNISKKALFKNFYQVKSDFYHIDRSDIDLHVSPVVHFSGGLDASVEGTPFINTRGVEARGMIDKKVGFYTFLGENQARFPGYVGSYVGTRRVVPNEGFWKNFKEGGYDFFTVRGYISFQATQHINLQFGHDHFNFGNGYRSMILSNFAPSYLFLKGNVDVWRLNYTFLTSQMTASRTALPPAPHPTRRYPMKYMSFHHLSINITDNFNIGLFEAVMYGVADSVRNNSFDVSYLNPIIFFRAIEQQNGSSDNAILGMDFKWNFLNRFSLYGQLVIDEFKLDQVRARNGWWANKFGYQLGLKYINFLGIENLDFQLEGNMARPFLYSHRTIYTNYAHYQQPLAHPLGANFKEVVTVIRYQPLPRLNLVARTIFADYGTDEPGTNFGGDFMKSYDTRATEDGHFIGQGVNNQLFFLDLTASYQLRHNLFIDVKQVLRNNRSEDPALDTNTRFTSIGVRLNIPQRIHDF